MASIKETVSHKQIFRLDELLSQRRFHVIWLGILSILSRWLGQFLKKGGSHSRCRFVKIVVSFHFLLAHPSQRLSNCMDTCQKR